MYSVAIAASHHHILSSGLTTHTIINIAILRLWRPVGHSYVLMFVVTWYHTFIVIHTLLLAVVLT